MSDRSRCAAAVARRSLAVDAYALLKRRIIRCEMPPGVRFTEGQLVQALGLGKTPVREALVRLVHEGLVRNMPRHGYEVTPITLEDAEDLFRLRRILEPAAMELAVGRIDGATRRRLEQLSRVESYSPGDPRSIEAYRRATHEFHVLVARLSGSHRLAAAIERLEDESDRMIHLGMEFRDRSETVRLGHQKLLAALVAGDVAAIRRLAFEGIQAAERVVRDALLASPVLRATPLGSAAPGGRAVARR